MNIHKLLILTTAVASTASLLLAAGSSAHSVASPFVKIGPQATLAGTVAPEYLLFTCQVVGLSPDITCYDPYQIRHAYGIDTLINAGFDGAGKTIVIIDAFQSPNIKAELNVFNTFYGLPSLNGLGGPSNSSLGTFTQIAPDGLTPFKPGDPLMTIWAQEISLDVLWAHAIAPAANIVLVLAKSNDDADLLSVTKYAVDHRLGDVISQSFGDNESCVGSDLLAEQHKVFAEATRKNITLFASSGDLGAGQPTCDGSALVRAVSSPAVDPLVTGVGGTELHAARYCFEVFGCDPATNPLPGTYQGEVAWNEPDIGATGGGFSVLFGEPPYQEGVVKRVPAVSDSPTGGGPGIFFGGAINGGKTRGVPDVSYSAAVLHGVLTYLDIPGLPGGPRWYLFGGTSAGSPQWAAIIAIADEKAGSDLGFINKSLYDIGRAFPLYAASFFDVTVGNNSFDGIAGFNAGRGWDPTTGLGSPKANRLVNYLIQFVSPGDGLSAIAGSEPHDNGQKFATGFVKPH
ncbi:MAG: S53 family peptidase [Acidobacteriaceae bacterium]|nr:S53 family peptidase [Acidobacteriaceae bacterium]MBV9502304.1 S53 family peptidase [Acidobacteriaceae bacterium]